MPRKRQTSRQMIAGPHGWLFLWTDGTKAHQILDGDHEYAYENVFLARDAWQRARTMTWAHEARRPWEAPEAAKAYDGFGVTPGRPVVDRAWDRTASNKQAKGTLRACRSWRKEANPTDPRLVLELDRYESLLESLIEAVGHHPDGAKAMSAWDHWTNIYGSGRG